jgi:hypothetical protein
VSKYIGIISISPNAVLHKLPDNPDVPLSQHIHDISSYLDSEIILCVCDMCDTYVSSYSEVERVYDVHHYIFSFEESLYCTLSSVDSPWTVQGLDRSLGDQSSDIEGVGRASCPRKSEILPCFVSIFYVILFKRV